MNRNYDDIIHLPHHVSTKHKPMPMEARAAQFAPFAALTGYGDAVQTTVEHHTDQYDILGRQVDKKKSH